MKPLFCQLFLFLFLPLSTMLAQDIEDKYLSEWKKFYPSKAVGQGMYDAIFEIENRSLPAINKWVAFNKDILERLSQTDLQIDPINARLLRVQAHSEIDQWNLLATHSTSLELYTHLIKKALTTVLQADYLLVAEKKRLICTRLKAIGSWATQAQENLKEVSQENLENGLEMITETLGYLENDFVSHLSKVRLANPCTNLAEHKRSAVQGLQQLKAFCSTELLPKAKSSSLVLGQQEYDRRLALYTDSKLTSKQLEEMALEEINRVKIVMAAVSKAYLLETYPNISLPETDLDIIQKALADMEKDAPRNATEYLHFWEQLADSAVSFIQKKDLATLPKNNTLRIQTAPESAGPAARIGWVASAPPFDPNPMTTLNLPSIPESLPRQEQIDFWASFNKPFNRMIVIHELYPGHYMQLKVSRETPHPVRLLFPYGIYIEGWATFTEKVLLDAGWESGNHLTLLAHLRKRLENANRAYTSVQVHCHGWKEDDVMQFSTETALLAPQFAKSLWGRIIASPMQLTSYFLGGAQFTDLLKSEQERLGTNFDLKFFMDTIMKAGPIPIDEFYAIFEKSRPSP
jgi:uncharacterized protein (DUF885 family)